MAGDTALALQLGHRQSADFDFFSQEDFDEAEMAQKLQSLGQYIPEQQAPKTMIGTFNQVKISLFHYKYPLVSDQIDCLGLKLASMQDIAAMKMAATLGRAIKKDYVDIYFLIKDHFPLEKMLDLYDQKYSNLEINRFALTKGLQYFEDAEITEMPIMFEEVNWEAVKEFLRSKAKKYWENL